MSSPTNDADTSALAQRPQRGSILRGIAVTLGLSAVCGVAGALVGALALTPLAVLDWSLDAALVVLAFGATLGAPLGMIVGPLFAWRLLRDVPLWRVVLQPAAGALAGGLAALGALFFLGDSRLGTSTELVFGIMLSLPLLGASAAALHLRRSVDRSHDS